MKRNQVFKNVTLLLLCLSIYSCSNELGFEIEEYESVIPEDLSSISPNEAFAINNDFETFAIMVQRSLKNKDFRVLLKETLEQRFDGDLNVLFKDLYLHDVKSTNVKDIFREQLSQMNKTDEILNNCFESNRIQIAMPVNIKKWNAVNDIPAITYIPIGYDERNTEFVKAFDSDGNEYSLDAKNAPDYPILVIGINERTNELGELDPDIEVPNNSEHYGQVEASTPPAIKSTQSTTPGGAPTNLTSSVAWANTIELSWTDNSSDEIFFSIERGQGGTYTQIGTTLPNENTFTSTHQTTSVPYHFRVRAFCMGWTSYSNILPGYYSTRDCRNMEHLWSMRYGHLSYFEGWLSGIPETRTIIVNKSGSVVKNSILSPPYRYMIDDLDWFCASQVEEWNPDYDGIICTYKFIEEDSPSTNGTISVPYYNDAGGQAGSVSVSVKNNHMTVAERKVYWHHAELYRYDSDGMFDFRLNNIGDY